MDTIDRAAAALGFAGWADMSAALYLMGADLGFALNLGQRAELPTATREQLAPGAIIAVHGHQCTRIARVWKVTPSKVSAVYLTPTAIERAQRYGKGVAVPNNITAKIADCGLVKVAPETEARIERETAEAAAPAPVGGGTQLVTDDAYGAGMLPLAGGDGFLF
ncbi:hypothetical protein [Pseudonocardia sp. McavD-2-B]|uniref:hypothetical protein n=1 Tax=Pseudonocardia sp. McavD-2-B TaxID=2954499 RepID=UPI00209855D4|nr:hypothetical protein [Pseudonocardia sp. McavD-2-B]MCO7195053.1 hypothetical protein [Pseudonocardia sp. McavD-2-B]